MNNEFLTPNEVAKMLNITIDRLAAIRCKDNKAIKQGLPISGVKWYILPNGRIRYKKSDVENYIQFKPCGAI